ncbi:aspartate aminotransferase-like enzyme [Bradyrhizobium sp. GM2.2]
MLRGDWTRAVRATELEALLRADKHHKIKAILVTRVDTASGVVNDIEKIGRTIRAAGHPALYIVDVVASLGCMPFEMDKWGIDVAMSGSQKGLMTPPGLSAGNPSWERRRGRGHHTSGRKCSTLAFCHYSRLLRDTGAANKRARVAPTRPI